MSRKKNCWEFSACGREPGGTNVYELGICPAAIAKNCDGIHGGVCGGRACWAISGTLCDGKLQGTIASKFKNCLKCQFYQQVLSEQQGTLLGADQIIARNQPEAITDLTAAAETSGAPFTVLVKRNDVPGSSQFRHFLEQRGCRVIEVANDHEVMALASRGQPDLILLGIALPAMDGLATYRTIRHLAHGSELPVIFLTTDDSRTVQSQGFKLGALAVIHTAAVNLWEELGQKIDRAIRLKLRMRGLTALVIDSNPISRRVITACLEQQGVTVLAASDENEARTIISATLEVDLVVAEVLASHERGLDFCRALRSRPPFADTPIILLCPEQLRPKILEFLQSGVTDYIIKPCPREELLARLLIHIESRQAIKRLTREVQRNKLLLESAGEGIIGLDLNGQVTFVNQAAGRMLGYAAAELIGRNLHGMTHHTTAQGQSFSTLDCPIQQSLEHGKIVTVHDDIFWRSDGSTLPIKYISTPILDQGSIRGAVVTFTDITTEKREEALRHDIERITRHDLKSPLNGIIGIPGLLLKDTNLSDRQRMLLGLLRDSGHRMLQMINESLNMYKMEKGTYEFSPTRIDLLAIIRSIVAESTGVAAKGLEVRITMEGEPCGNDQTFLVQGEEMLSYSMLANLIKNAVEASPAVGTIDIDLTHSHPLAKVVIHNQGVVVPEIRERFFDKYSTAGKDGGTGLGTYSAKLIAETQHGSIAMTSDPEEGTALIVHLPVGQA